MSNRIVFFAGYSSSKWNANTQLPGGSEVAVANISKNLALRGNDVWVAGDVIEADIGLSLIHISEPTRPY